MEGEEGAGGATLSVVPEEGVNEGVNAGRGLWSSLYGLLLGRYSVLGRGMLAVTHSLDDEPRGPSTWTQPSHVAAPPKTDSADIV